MPQKTNQNASLVAGSASSALPFTDDTGLAAPLNMLTSRAASAFYYANEAIIITDADGIIVDVNPAFFDLTGLSYCAALGKTLEAFTVLALDDSRPMRVMRDDQRLRDRSKSQVSYRRHDGQLYPGMLSVNRVRNARDEIDHHVVVLSDLSETPAHARHLNFDSLTGLPNLQLLMQLIQASVQQAETSAQSVFVCSLDIDHFQATNERLGACLGDKLLSTFAQRIGRLLSGDDVLARVGGDEFVLLLHHGDECGFFDNLLATIRKPLTIDGQDIYLTASLGITRFPDDDAPSNVLLRHAHQAMFRAKQLGRDTYHFFDPNQDRLLQVRYEQRQRFKEAIEQGELRLFYQPQVDMASGQVVGVEALIRWQHPEKGLLSPDKFLPTIEATPLERDLGEWVVEQSLQQLTRWLPVGISLPINVNISPTHLLNPDFAERLAVLLTQYPTVSPSMLKLEVLESAAMHDMQTALNNMAQCKALGVCFAIDDFGTGFSSLTHLRQLPVNLIKIDQSFVRDMLSDQDDMAIVESVIYMANRFKRPMLAEGVETLEHAKALLSLGCELAQGYGIARPMSPEALPEWLSGWPLRDDWKQLTTLH